MPSEAGGTHASRPAARAARPNRAEPGARRASLDALIELLADDSESVANAVREELERRGSEATSALQRALGSEDPRRRMRARDILASRRRRDVHRRLLRHAARRKIDLESALFLLGNLGADELDARPYRRALDAMAKAVRERMAAEEDPLAKALALPRYLGEELGFGGAEDDYHHPDNIHVHRVIERRAGMPLSLCAIYLFVARRAGLRAALLPMPGHVLLRLYYGDSGRSVLLDPFQGGKLRSRADCVAYLRECNLVPQPEWFEDASDTVMFLRHVMNLATSMRMRGLAGRARELQRLAEVLAAGESRRRRPALLD